MTDSPLWRLVKARRAGVFVVKSPIKIPAPQAALKPKGMMPNFANFVTSFVTRAGDDSDD